MSSTAKKDQRKYRISQGAIGQIIGVAVPPYLRRDIPTESQGAFWMYETQEQIDEAIKDGKLPKERKVMPLTQLDLQYLYENCNQRGSVIRLVEKGTKVVVKDES